MLKVAIIGAGNISPAHIEGYLQFPERCKIVAVCDIYEQKAKRRIAQYKLSGAVSCIDYKEILSMDVDLVSVCTPPYTHAQISIDLLRAGKHVIVEKPMAASLEECDAMNAAAEASGKILSVVAQNRFLTPMMKLKSVIDSGLIGRIVHAQVDSHWWRAFCFYELWWRGTWEEEGGGCTINQSIHHIDALLWMMGSPEEVNAVMSNTAHDNIEVEDLSITILKYPNGALGQLTSSVVHHGEEQQIVFHGTEARVSAPWKVYATMFKPNGLPDRYPDLERRIQDLYDSLPDVRYEAHTGQIDNVLTAVEQSVPVLIDGQSGKATLQLITAIYKSASTGARVTLPLQPGDPFYTRKGLLQHATHFYEKKTSVENFTDIGIQTGSD